MIFQVLKGNSTEKKTRNGAASFNNKKNQDAIDMLFLMNGLTDIKIRIETNLYSYSFLNLSI